MFKKSQDKYSEKLISKTKGEQDILVDEFRRKCFAKDITVPVMLVIKHVEEFDKSSVISILLSSKREGKMKYLVDSISMERKHEYINQFKELLGIDHDR